MRKERRALGRLHQTHARLDEQMTAARNNQDTFYGTAEAMADMGNQSINIAIDSNTYCGDTVMHDEYGELDLSKLPAQEKRKYPHYFKDVSHLDEVDVYRVLDLFGVTDSAMAHAAKKILCAGIRGAKDQQKDIAEAIDTLQRRQEMWEEDAKKDST